MSCGRTSSTASSAACGEPHDDRLRVDAPLVERVAHELQKRLGEDKVAAHHGSMARTPRLEAEAKLKSGEVPVVVATASLELGIDVGTVDLVCHVGAPRAIATLLQRSAAPGTRAAPSRAASSTR
jgi:Lhr-like helicase